MLLIIILTLSAAVMWLVPVIQFSPLQLSKKIMFSFYTLSPMKAAFDDFFLNDEFWHLSKNQ